MGISVLKNGAWTIDLPFSLCLEPEIDEKKAKELEFVNSVAVCRSCVSYLAILGQSCVSLAPQLSSLVKPGGRLALSGILAEQGEDVAAAYAKDFELDPIANRDGWVRISGRRR